MKKTEAVESITKFVGDRGSGNYNEIEEIAPGLIDYLVKELGFLPPIKTVILIPDELRGGMKHGPTERGWDEE